MNKFLLVTNDVHWNKIIDQSTEQKISLIIDAYLMHIMNMISCCDNDVIFDRSSGWTNPGTIAQLGRQRPPVKVDKSLRSLRKLSRKSILPKPSAPRKTCLDQLKQKSMTGRTRMWPFLDLIPIERQVLNVLYFIVLSQSI